MSLGCELRELLVAASENDKPPCCVHHSRAGSVRRGLHGGGGGVRELKNALNSVTVQNRTHVYMEVFDHKDLENHLLQ